MASYTVDEVSQHSSEEDAWIINNSRVFNVTDFLSRHPGGKEVLFEKLGQDVSKIMSDHAIHKHSPAAYNLLRKYYIGQLYSEDNPCDRKEELNMDGYKESELVDWDKPMVAQVGKLGSEYMKWVHSPVDRPLRLFETPIVEFFSRTPWYIVPTLWLPIVLYIAIVGLVNLRQDVDKTNFLITSFLTYVYGGIFLAFVCLFMTGIFLWSLIEYILHRYLFHIIPPDDSPFWITFHFFFHGQHHKVPFDTGRLVFPPVAASAFAIPFYSLFIYFLPYGVANSVFSGGLLGYVMYDCIHYYLHHGSPTTGSYFYNLRSYHVAHHFENPHQAYGISSKLWDFPFKTNPVKTKQS